MLKMAVSASPVGLQHRIDAGSKFDGTLPTTEMTVQNGINKYASHTAGGLFFFNNYRPISILQYQFDLGASLAYTLSLVSLAEGEELPGEVIQLSAGTARTVVGPERFNLVLGPNQALKLVVTASSASAPMIGCVWAVDATAHLVG